MSTIGKCTISGHDVPKSKGIIKITPDGKPNLLLNRKCKTLFNRNIKSQKILWTKGSRFFHKKGNAILKEKKEVIQIPKIVRGFPLVSRKLIEEIKVKKEKQPVQFRKQDKIGKQEKSSKQFSKKY